MAMIDAMWLKSKFTSDENGKMSDGVAITDSGGAVWKHEEQDQVH